MADLNVIKPRVNAAMFAKYQGKMVTVIGSAHDVINTDNDGMGFALKTSDGQDVHVKLNEQLQDYVEGLVEVQGIIDNGNNINCLNFVQFAPEASNNFDMDAYDKAINLIMQNPNHYFQRSGYPQAASS